MATELFTDKQMVLNARPNLTGILPVQDLRIFDLGNARYLAEPLAKTINVPGLDSDPERISLVTIVVVPSDPDEAGEWLGRLVQQWLELDDVLTSDFLDSVLLVQADEHQESSRNVHTSAVMRKEWGISHITTVSKSSLAIDLAPGPYVFWKGELCRPYRFYDDPNLAFVVATQSQEGKSGYRNLGLVGNSYSGLSVAVPSRVVQSQASRRPLAGLRFAVKDIFDIAGIRTTAGCRAFFDLFRPSVTTAPAVQTLVNQGAVLLGTLKLGSLVTREEPTESVDYHAAFNPRGDGYQSAWSSSGGSGAAIAAYDWLDFTIATTGSSRRPAMANGLFSIRLSKDAVPTDGIVPSWKKFDSPALFGRDILQFENIIGSWIVRATHNTDELPISLVYPTDFWPIDIEQQMKLVHDFVSDFEKAHGTNVKKISIAHEWSISRPKEAGSPSIQEYLENVGVNSLCYGVYHELDSFREEYLKRFHKKPYVNPVMQWRWSSAKIVTEEQYVDAVHKLDIFRDWFLEEILHLGEENTFLILPITSQAVDYRDVPPAPPGAPAAFDGIWLAPILGSPEMTIPIGEMEYDSRISGNRERLPIVVSVLSSPSSDMELIATLRKVLEVSKRPTAVRTGSRLFV